MARFVALAVGASALITSLVAACGAVGDERTSPSLASGSSVVAPTTAGPADPATTSTTAASATPAPAVSRPGPPAAGRCVVTVDDPAPKNGTVAATVVSGVRGATFLARAADATAAATESGTTDASGRGSVALRVAGQPRGRSVTVEVSVAGGAEVCSTAFTVP